MSAEPLLSVRNLRTWIDSGDAVVRAVEGASFDIAAGETLALLGESGCGKSITALSITRLLPDAAFIAGGEVRFDGADLLAMPESGMREVRGRRIAMIFQEPNLALNAVMTAGEQIAETLRRHTALAGAALDARVLELLDAVRMPDALRRRNEYPFQLSGGMKQRVMIAIALACNPELLIADEPTTALDVTIQAQVTDLLKDLQKERQMALLLITHDLAIVSEMAHRVAVMYAGEIVEIAARDKFFVSPSHPYSRKLFDSLPTLRKRGEPLAVIKGSVPALTQAFSGCRFADRCESVLAHCGTHTPRWRDLDAETGVRCHLFDAKEVVQHSAVTQSLAVVAMQPSESPEPLELRLAIESSGTLLEVRDLKVHFPIRKGLLKRVVGHVKAVDGVTLSIEGGRTLGLVGESGCGKTTIGKGIVRLVDSTSGAVLFEGADLLQLRRASMREQRKHVQIIFQDPYSSLNPRMRIADTIEEGMVALDVCANRIERQTRIDALLTEVGLDPDAKYRYPHEFSGGQRQRIAIARALAVEPKLIVCDEPTSALDVSVQAQILNLLKQLQAKKGLAYLFITHNISVVEFIAHDVAVMYLGRIVELGSVDEVLRAPKHPYTRALLSAVPEIDRGSRRAIIRLEGDIPSAINPPQGCHFHPRCSEAMDECRSTYPALSGFSATHHAHCHLYRDIS